MVERLNTITGPMFSGKTAELLRLIERAEIAGLQVQIFKPAIDDRWDKENLVCSHAGHEHHAIPVKEARGIIDSLEKNTQVVAIDEAQFFDEGIVPVVKFLTEHDIHVIVAGLPLNFRGEPFGSMPHLLALADEITNLTAICTYSENSQICGQPATRTQRLVNGQPANYKDKTIVVGCG